MKAQGFLLLFFKFIYLYSIMYQHDQSGVLWIHHRPNEMNFKKHTLAYLALNLDGDLFED